MKVASLKLRELGDEKEQIYYQELRIAALLHDIGHGPLSHLFDKFLMSRKSFFTFIENDEYLKTHKASFELICPPKTPVEHEHMSCIFVFTILNELKKQLKLNKKKFSPSAQTIIKLISPERVVKLIEPKFIIDHNFIDSKGNNYTNFFSNIISAFPLDADRMDYLLRDSYFSGVNYGFYDINRLFASFMATHEQNIVNLTIKESGLDSVLRFIQSRTHLYNQVYFHKTNRAANTMLSAATETKRGSIKLLDNKNIVELENFYIKNSDEYFITETSKKILTSSNIEKEILEELTSRKLFKRLFEHKIILSSGSFKIKKAKIDEIINRIKEKLYQLQGQNKFAFIDSFSNEAFKDSTKKAIKIAKKDKQNGKYNTDINWHDLNLEFENADLISIMVRIYLRRTFSNPNEFKIMKNEILRYINIETKELEAIKEYKRKPQIKYIIIRP